MLMHLFHGDHPHADKNLGPTPMTTEKAQHCRACDGRHPSPALNSRSHGWMMGSCFRRSFSFFSLPVLITPEVDAVRTVMGFVASVGENGLERMLV